ncbi:hypothetical protein F4604DRAFT_1116965 [Suillus subluteus]|nr:hypothetical protein F4604DRAFT_1116965 [Suillus subluteus]
MELLDLRLQLWISFDFSGIIGSECLILGWHAAAGTVLGKSKSERWCRVLIFGTVNAGVAVGVLICCKWLAAADDLHESTCSAGILGPSNTSHHSLTCIQLHTCVLCSVI